MKTHLATCSSVALAAVLLSTVALAQGRGEGAIVIRDKAPIYLKSTGSAVLDTRARGDCVVGITTMMTISSFQFEDEDGRLHVAYFRDKDQKGLARMGWMAPSDLARFTYECGCGSRDKPCSAFSSQGFDRRWNTCFLEAKDKKLAELGAPTEPHGAVTDAAGGASANPAEKPLTNDDVVAMTKAGLGDDIITTKIQQSNGQYDTSADGLISLKKSGVSKPVMDAMLKKPSGVGTPKTKPEVAVAAAETSHANGVVVNGKQLVLSGSGLRRRMMVAVYAGDLYLEAATHDPSVVVGADQIKRLVLRILMEQIPKEQLVSVFTNGFKERSKTSASVKQASQQFVSWLDTVRAGDEIVMTYVPGSGTTLSVAGQTKGTIEGKEFSEALLSIWFGADPVDDDFKKEILGQT